MPYVIEGLKINPASDEHAGIMSAADQISFFRDWCYYAEEDVFVKPKQKLVLSPEAFDRQMGGRRWFIGYRDGAAEYTSSASHAYTHTRVIRGFVKFVNRTESA